VKILTGYRKMVEDGLSPPLIVTHNASSRCVWFKYKEKTYVELFKCVAHDDTTSWRIL